jgi:hypothetical protein
MDQPSLYRIRVRSHVDASWSDWFEGFAFTHEPNGETILTGPIVDQSALQGVLAKISSLGLTLVSVNPVTPEGD